MLQAELKKYFWDVDFDLLDLKKHKKFILERILELGNEKATRWMKDNFTKEDILNVLKNSRRISKKSAAFWNLILK